MSIQQKEQQLALERVKNQERKNFIKAQREMAGYKKNEFIHKKIEDARKDTNQKMNQERDQIKQYEVEAQ